MAEGKTWGRESRRQRRETARELAKELISQNIHAEKKNQFRLDFTLAFVGIVITILLVLIAPQSKWGTGVWLVVAFTFGFYPMQHLASWVFGWIKWRWLRSVMATVLLAIIMVALTMRVWPRFRRHILSADERAKFEAPLKTQNSDQQEIHIACPASDEKACEFATQFVAIFGESGWKVQTAVDRETFQRPKPGVWFLRKGGAQPKTPYDWNVGGWMSINDATLLNVQKAFQNLGIEPDASTGYEFPEGVMIIYFGTERENEGEPTDLTRSTEWVTGKKTGPFPQPQDAP